jgi:hypothetical protein
MTYRYPGGLIRRTAANTAITGASGVWDLGSQAQAVKNNTWPISGLANPVSGSLRFRASNSAYLNRTLTTPTNNLRWTWSAWVKRGTLGTTNILFGAGDGSSDNFGSMQFRSEDTLQFAQINGGTYNVQVYTTAVFRDPSAWYHVVLVYDSPNATSTDRIQIYVNGTRQTALTYATGPFAQNTSSKINSAIAHYISKLDYTSLYFDGCMAEVNFIDGQALTPASFGQTSAITGVWEPIKYTGTYGTNGFYLSLSDTSSIGKDFSGNGNNWTPNNISTTSGSTFDLMRDVPTQYTPQGATDIGGTVRGNYAVMNPISQSSYITSNGANLNTVGNTTTDTGVAGSTFGLITGKWYVEYTVNATNSNRPGIGIIANPTGNFRNGDLDFSNAGSFEYYPNGALDVAGSRLGTFSSFTTNDIIGIAIDCDNGAAYVSKNNTWQNSGVPTSGASKTGAVVTWTPTSTYTQFVAVSQYSSSSTSTNFGQRPFAYTPPSGFKSLCTTNLPTPTIGATAATAANKYFDATLYNGNNGTQNITNAGGFQPDLVWVKVRNTADDHFWYDSVRGATKYLSSNNTAAEGTIANGLTAFNSNGFALGDSGSTNNSSNNFVAWQLNAGGSTVTNTTGSISAQVRANPTSGFSIATFTGNGTGGATVGHGLGVAPAMIMFKGRNTGTSGLVWHTGYGTNQGQMLIDSTAAIYNPGNGLYFNNTYPSSTVVTLGTSGATNGSGQTYVLYSWAPVAGYSAFGSYTGNGSTNGPFIYTGFRPRFILFKCSSNQTSSTVWSIFDTARSPSNAALKELYPNASTAEGTDSDGIDILSNGFKPKRNSEYLNFSGWTYIYAAFAEFPFKNSLAR